MMAEEGRELTALLETLEKFPPLRYPLIHWAALIGRVDLARRILVLEPDPNEVDMFGFTALDRIHEGGGHGDIDGMMRYLLSVGGTYNVYQ